MLIVFALKKIAIFSQYKCSFEFHAIYFTGSTRDILDRNSASVTFTVSNVTSLYQTVDQDFSVDVDKHEDSTLIYLSTDIDVFKNSFVINLFQAVVSLVGVFVFFFAACVVTYIYFKCFRHTTDGKRLKSNQCESEYKSLSFEAVEYESPLNSEQEQRANLELTYLTPVLRNDEKSETNILAESEMVADIPMHNPHICLQTRDESKLTTDNLQDHVYIEILNDNIERTGVHEDSQSERLKYE